MASYPGLDPGAGACHSCHPGLDPGAGACHSCHPGLDPGLSDDDLYTRILVLLKIYLELGLLRVDIPGKYANMAFVRVIHY